MNVCMLAYTFYENDNRVKRYAETLTHAGHKVDVIALRRIGQPFYSKHNNVNIFRIQRRLINEKWKLSYLFRILCFFIKSLLFVSIKHFDRKYPLVHVHSVPDFEVFAAVFLKLTGARIILDIHDIVPEFYLSKFGKNSTIAFPLLLMVEKLSCSFSDHVITSNSIWQRRLSERSVNRNKCTTIINFPELTLFSRNNNHKQSTHKYLLYPGTINYHQGVDIAVNAFSMIAKQYPELYLFIYGDGPEKNSICRLIYSHNLTDRIILRDFLPIEEIVPIMANALIGIIPKRDDAFGGEAFSTKSLEFIALEVPIVISHTRIDSTFYSDSIVKFFKPEDSVDLAKAITCLLDDEDYRSSLIRNGKEFIKKNNWNVKQNEYLEIVSNLCHGTERL